MTQANIEIMDRIVDALAANKKLSDALSEVYTKRNVGIPFNWDMFDVRIMDLGMTSRTTNALLRAKLQTLNDVLMYNAANNIISVKNFARSGCIELMETILDYCWDNMDIKAKTAFLIDVVERNSKNVC